MPGMRSWRTDIGHHCRRRGPLAVAAAALALLAPTEHATDRPDARPAISPAPITAAPTPPALPAATAPHESGLRVVVLADGAPAADAEVSISDGSSPVLATTRTDREGHVRFADLPPGPYELWAARDAQASSLVRLELDGDARAELELQPATIVQGELVLDGSVPLGASVQLVPLDLDHAVRVASVDDTGRFVVAGVPAGRWRIEADVPGYVQTDEAIVIAREAETTTSLALVRTGAIVGKVVDSSGVPIANATVTLRDSAGKPLWPFTLAPSRARWIHPLAGARQLPVNGSTRFGAVRPGSRPAECGRGHCGVDLGHERGHVVHAVANGTVAALFPENRTEAGRVVAIQHGGGLRSMYMHLDEIRPGLEVGQPVRAGEPIGTVGSTGILRSVPHLHFAVTQEHRGRTWYVDPEPMLRHAIVLPTPRALEPVTDARPDDAAPTVASAGATTRFTTDAAGAFRIDGVAPGSYVAVAFASELAPGASGTLDVRSGETTSAATITLRDGTLVVGHVVGPRGAIAGAQVIATAGLGASAAKVASTTTDQHGGFTLRALSGKITLVVNAAGYSTGERTITVDDRDASRAHREAFALEIEDAQLRGQLLAPDGGAAIGVSVRIVDGVSRRTTTTDGQGRFVLEPVVAGRYLVELSSPDYPRKRVTLDTTRWAEHRLDRGGALRALVRASRDPLVGARVTARGPSGQIIERATDASGTIDLRALTAGTWTLSVRARGHTPASREVTVRAGALADDIHLELARAASLAGVVRDRFGQRVAGAKLTLAGTSTVSASDGSFRLVDVPTGRHILEAEHDTLHGSLAIELSPGDDRQSLTIELR